MDNSGERLRPGSYVTDKEHTLKQKHILCDGGHSSANVDTPEFTRHKRHTNGQILHNVLSCKWAIYPFAFGQFKLAIVRLLFMIPETSEKSLCT